MLRFMVAMLLLGAALLGVVLYQTDLGEVASLLRRLGPAGLGAILGVYVLAFGGVAASWLCALPGVPATPRWFARLYRVALVGDALEQATPLAAVGGDSVKAIIVKRHYGVGLREATASLVVTRVTDLCAQLLVIAAGFALLVRSGILTPAARAAVGLGLLVFATATVLFFLSQRLRLYSRVRAWLGGGPWARWSSRGRVEAVLDGLADVEDQLVAFYRERRLRTLASTGAALLDWTLSAAATWLGLWLLGAPVGVADAVVIESTVVLVRSLLFVVPADLGTQDGALVLICAAVVGSPELGLALAAIRRCRDVLWLAAGLLIGARYSVGPELLRGTGAEEEALEG